LLPSQFTHTVSSHKTEEGKLTDKHARTLTVHTNLLLDTN